MYEITKKVHTDIPRVALENLIVMATASTIFVCERESDRTQQYLLVKKGNTCWFWIAFYISTNYDRPIHKTLRDAVAYRLKRNYLVYGLSNKTELKEFIKQR